MIAIAQVITSGNVAIEGDINSKRFVKNGLLVFLGVASQDSEKEATKICEKLIKLRVFPDKDQKMNLDIKSINGEVMLISQFTLLGDTKGNNRPDFTKAAGKDLALGLYEQFADKLKSANISVTKGYFGEHMNIQVNHAGPVTIILDSDKL